MQPVTPLRTSLLAAWGMAIAIAISGCGGADGPADAGSPVAASAPATQPRYQTRTSLLVLPKLLAAGRLHFDVVLKMSRDGSWELVSAGTVRAATADDHAEAVLQAANAAQTLADADVDAMLNLKRVHFDNRVLADVAIRLQGRTWSMTTLPKDAPALGADDFKMNPALAAGDHQHLVLNSAPDSGMQSVPMYLKNRKYRFCMEAQAEGADSLTMLDAQGQAVFRLKAGDACFERKFAAGQYTLQHGYGGTGGKRTVFMRPTAVAAAAPSSAMPRAVPRTLALKSAVVDNPEYWIVSSSQFGGAAVDADPSSILGYIDYGRIYNLYDDPSVPHPCFGGFGTQSATDTPKSTYDLSNLLRISKDALGNPVGIDGVLKCALADSTYTGYTGGYTMIQGLNDAAPGSNFNYVRYIRSPSVYPFPPFYHPTWGGSYYQPLFSTNGLPLTVEINNFANNSLNLYANVQDAAQSGGIDIYALVDPMSPGGVSRRLLSLPLSTGFPFILRYRYFADGALVGSPSAPLVSGQVALYGGSDCTGAVAISEASNIADLPALRANLLNPGARLSTVDVTGAPWPPTTQGSLLLGPDTEATAYTGPNYTGASQRLVSSGCIVLATIGQPQSLTIEIDTAEMVISTGVCEACNLGKLDFRSLSQSLKGVKLRGSNLAGTVFNDSDLSSADLRNTILQGAHLTNANLSNANLSCSSLNGSGSTQAAATLNGAHLKDANLAGVDMSGASFRNASFFTSVASGACVSACGDPITPNPICASAYNATMNTTSFVGAYLAGVDMSKTTAYGVDFTNAMLFGAQFVDAKLDHNANTSSATSFNGAYLQGANFGGASSFQYANFTNAYVDIPDPTGADACMLANLPTVYIAFPGFKVLSSDGSSCMAPSSPIQTTCVGSASYTAGTVVPATNSTNICPDGYPPAPGASGCSVASWRNPATPFTGASPTSCSTTPALCGDGFNPPNSGPNTCW